MANPNKLRQPRLRASCDGCFLAKVKCSKARPICSRCLTCGIECKYSPSSRAGKPKASESAKNQQKQQRNQQPLPPVTTDGLMFAVNAGLTSVYKLETGWTTPPTTMDEALSRNHSISSGLTFMGVDNASPAHMDGAMARDMYGPTMPWTPPSDISSSAISESPVIGALPHRHSRSHSYDIGGTGMGWIDNTPEIFPFNQAATPPTMASSYFPSPTATPHMKTIPSRPNSTSTIPTGGSCTCFTLCLQSLQALHNAATASPPPFDLVLSLNRKAVEGCAAMLACTRCMSRSGTHTAVMLLATVLGTITAFYKSASESYFDLSSTLPDHSAISLPSNSPAAVTTTPTVPPGLGISFGAYTVLGDDSRWLELEILSRELRKLEEVYAGFRDACAELSEDLEVSKAMVAYLGHSLGSTMQVVSHRKGDMSGGLS